MGSLNKASTLMKRNFFYRQNPQPTLPTMQLQRPTAESWILFFYATGLVSLLLELFSVSNVLSCLPQILPK